MKKGRFIWKKEPFPDVEFWGIYKRTVVGDNISEQSVFPYCYRAREDGRFGVISTKQILATENEVRDACTKEFMDHNKNEIKDIDKKIEYLKREKKRLLSDIKWLQENQF